jgi:hypothetical protein
MNRLFAILIVASFSPLANAISERILAAETWNGAYLLSTTNVEWDKVQLQLCGLEKSGNCQKVVERDLHYEELHRFNQPLLQELRAFTVDYRRKLSQSYFRYFERPETDSNLRALKEMISSLEREGLESWVLNRAGRAPSAKFTSDKILKSVAQIFSRVLEKPLTPPTPESKPVEMAETLR